jgi:type IV secretory pathway VirB2 component (pilin)
MKATQHDLQVAAASSVNKTKSLKMTVKDFAIALLIALAFLAAMAYMSPAMAGTDNAFEEIITWLKNMLEGSGGKFIAVLGFVIALGSGLLKDSLIGIVFGLGLASAAVYGPNILSGILSMVF